MNGKVEKKIIRWSNFTKGYGGDKYYAPRNSYYDAYNIDTTNYKAQAGGRNAIFLTPESGVNINCFYQEADSNIISVLDNRKVYNNSTYKQTLGSGEYTRIVPMYVSGTKYLYVFEFKSINGTMKIQKLQFDGTFSSEITYTSSGMDTAYVPPSGNIILYENDRIIFSNHNNLFIIDNTDTVSSIHGFPASEHIVGLTSFQGDYFIYTNDKWSNSFKYKWSGVGGDSFTLQRLVNMYGYDLRSLVNDGAYDYGMMNNKLFRFSGVQYEEIISDIGGQLLKNFGGWIYHSWTGRENIGGLNRFGNEPGFGKGLHSYSIIKPLDSYTISSKNDNTSYGFSGNIYYIVNDAIYKTLTTSSGSIESYIISNQFVGEDIRELKIIELIYFKYANTDIDNKVKLEVKVNDTGSWIEIFEGYNGEIPEDVYGRRIIPQKFTNQLGTFNEIAFRVSLPTNGVKKPYFIGLDVIYTNDTGY